MVDIQLTPNRVSCFINHFGSVAPEYMSPLFLQGHKVFISVWNFKIENFSSVSLPWIKQCDNHIDSFKQ